MTLAKFKEQISDDFQSTFTVVDEYTLQNMMGLPGDFDELRKIVRKYIPNAELEFIKTDEVGKYKAYDIYLMRLKHTSEVEK